MSTATLGDIINKVRKLTGSGNSLQITDSEIIDYINSFYLYDFPSQFRSLQLVDTFTINTVQNIDTYAFDFEHYETIQQPVYVNKKLIPLYNTPLAFYGLFFNWQNREQLATADGTAGPYSGTVQSSPIIRSYNNNPAADTELLGTSSFTTGSYPPSFAEPHPSRVQNILITTNTATATLNVTDDGDGNLIGDATAGTINYLTGAIAGLTFSAAVPSGNEIYISYNLANQSIPQACLFWKNQITLRPVPDSGYTVEITAYRRPSQVLLGTGSITNMDGVPELKEWFETLAFGAAKKIYQDRQDMQGVAMMDQNLQAAYALNETRTYAQIGTRQIGTIFSGQLNGYGGGWLPFGGNNG